MTTKAEVIGRVAVATAGRDKGRRFAVIGTEGTEYVLLADGRLRKAEKPKRKKLKHVRFEPWRIDPALFGDNAANAHLRKALGALGNDQDTDFEEG